MSAAVKQEVQEEAPTKEATPPKVERTPEETQALKREFLLGFNSYHVGSYKQAALDKVHNHIFQGDGDYLVVNNRIGNFIVKQREAKRPGLPEEFKGHMVQLKVPKIPKEIYYQIVNFFRDICDEIGEAEAFCQVYYDKTESKYVVHVPEQTVSKGSVKYDAKANLDNTDRERYVFVFECHSHNTMGAFWSGTDNADEKDTRFYGVFGKIKDEQPEEKFRFMAMGQEIAVGRSIIFDFEEVKHTPFPESWKTNVKKPAGIPQTSHGYVGGKTYGPSWSGGSHSPNHYGQDWGEDDEDDPWYTGEYHAHRRENNLKKSSGMSTFNDDLPEEMDEIDIEETFNLENYEEEIHSICIETFIENLTPNQVTIALEAMCDHGYDSIIQEFQRR